MVSLGQKLKMPKTCEKPFYKIIRVVLCKKPLKKKINKYSRNENIFKINHFPKAIAYAKAAPCKMVSLGQKLKMPKTCEKPFSKIIRFFFLQKTEEKKLNIGEMKKILKLTMFERL